jgi:hypothetical protein
MRVDEITTFERYWSDARFAAKRPNLRGSLVQAYGDNIYRRDRKSGLWRQADSYHSLPGGRANLANVRRDTQSEKVLISKAFAYWGGEGPEIPAKFRQFRGEDVCAGRGHRNRFSQELVTAFVAWLRTLGVIGVVGDPLDWRYGRVPRRMR